MGVAAGAVADASVIMKSEYIVDKTIAANKIVVEYEFSDAH